MPRNPRSAKGRLVYHVHNRVAGRRRLFKKTADYKQFEQVLSDVYESCGCRILSYCALPDHWHLLLWPRRDGELSDVMRLLTVTHSRRVQSSTGTIGNGPLYQGRFKSFPVQSDAHCLDVVRFVESHALRAGLVRRAENWKWSSLYRRTCGDNQSRDMLADWPVPTPRRWLARVNRAVPDVELDAMCLCTKRGRPHGDERWVMRTAKRLGIESTMRPQGRPRKHAPLG